MTNPTYSTDIKDYEKLFIEPEIGHNPFALKPTKFSFSNNVEFGSSSECDIPNIGDLLHKCHIRLTLPSISLPRNDTIDIKAQYITALDNLTSYEAFMVLNNEAYRVAIHEHEPINSIDAQDIYNGINDHYFINDGMSNIQTSIELLMNDIENDDNITFNMINIRTIITNIKSYIIDKDIALLYVKTAHELSIIVHKFFIDEKLRLQALHEDSLKSNANFAWKKNIGFQIIDSVSIEIGGVIYDSHTTEIMELKQRMTTTWANGDVLDKCIGNVKELTTYNRDVKDTYTLYIPLYFWFCERYDQALPLLMLTYNEVRINLSLKPLMDCILTDADTDTFIQPAYLDAHIMTDIIHLTNIERARFVSSQYLLNFEQSSMQRHYSNSRFINVDLNLENCTKLISWTLSKGTLISCSLLVDGVSYGTKAYDDKFFNCVQANRNIQSKHGLTKSNYEILEATDSIVYQLSFALSPYMNMPTGTINASRIERISLSMEVSDEDTILNIASLKYNILRMHHGKSELMFVTPW